MRKAMLTTLLWFFAASTLAADGVIQVPSDFSVSLTSQRMVSLLKGKGMTIFNRVKHSEAAKQTGVILRDTELIIFGNPKVGSSLIKCEQQVALDLPQKVLIWEDAMAKVWISYNDPRYLEKRHSISGCENVIAKIERVLTSTAQSAATK